MFWCYENEVWSQDENFMNRLENWFAWISLLLNVQSICWNFKQFRKLDFDNFDNTFCQTTSIISYATKFALILKRIIQSNYGSLNCCTGKINI